MARRGRKHDKSSVKAAESALEMLVKNGENVQELRTKQAIMQLKKKIKAARKNGATWQEITETLQNSGVNVSMRTIVEQVGGGKKKVAPASAPPKAPPAAVPGQFQIRPDRGADL